MKTIDGLLAEIEEYRRVIQVMNRTWTKQVAGFLWLRDDEGGKTPDAFEAEAARLIDAALEAAVYTGEQITEPAWS